MSQPLISVIVPIYNVEKYVRKCLDSLKNQTMKQIEVICIDDGSTDDSGRIAEEYKDEEGWPAIRIIHTKNRGLSAARNRGIDEAKAEWIMFVDSDDWVEPGFCEIPYKAAVENKADLVIFGGDTKKRLKKECILQKNAPEGIITELIAHEYGRTYAWNKLYKRYLFKSVRFPEGHNYEDIATTHKLVHEANRIVLLPECLYHHVSRTGSITKSKTLSNRRDYFVSTMDRYTFLAQLGFSSEKLDAYLIESAIGYLFIALPSDEQYGKAKDIVDSCRAIPKILRWKQKVILIIWKINSGMLYKRSKVVKRPI